jgi:hypothetical protein
MNKSIAGATCGHKLALTELRFGLGAWGAFILATCTYCLLHQAFVSAGPPDPMRTLAIALREWGAWALLAPWALRMFGRLGWRDASLRIAGLALLAASLPIVADQFTAERSLGASLALFWPRNIAMAVALCALARLVNPAPEATHEHPSVDQPGTLLVSKGADQCLIQVDDIRHLSAAGNYVDIHAGDQRYLLRATMGDVESLLPPAQFVRIHRSHMVRVREIERIRLERSGSGTVHLRGGATLPISRSYRAHLKSLH